MDWGEVGKAVLVGLPAFLIGYLGWRRSMKVDRLSALSGAVSETRAGTGQIIDGLNSLIDNLQDDNRSFREDIRLLNVRLDACIADREELRRRLNELIRRHGENE